MPSEQGDLLVMKSLLRVALVARIAQLRLTEPRAKSISTTGFSQVPAATFPRVAKDAQPRRAD
jgi:hypothetical protein